MTSEERAVIEAEIRKWEEFREVAGWIAQAAADGPPKKEEGEP